MRLVLLTSGMYTDIIWHLNFTQWMLDEDHRMEVANTVLVSVLPEVWGPVVDVWSPLAPWGTVYLMVCPGEMCV